MREPSTRTRKASQWPSWDTHNSSRCTHDLEGAWGATLEAKWDLRGGSLPFIAMEAVGSRSSNWSATRSSATQGVLWH